jgi:hypothetical protein
MVAFPIGKVGIGGPFEIEEFAASSHLYVAVDEPSKI